VLDEPGVSIYTLINKDSTLLKTIHGLLTVVGHVLINCLPPQRVASTSMLTLQLGSCFDVGQATVVSTELPPLPLPTWSTTPGWHWTTR
jgi:hypothetical protein